VHPGLASARQGMGIQLADSSDSMSSAGTGRDSRKPCTRRHPYRISVCAAIAVSTPSATSSRPNASASPMIAADDRQISWVDAQVAYESRVDLERTDRKGFQVLQDGIAGGRRQS